MRRRARGFSVSLISSVFPSLHLRAEGNSLVAAAQLQNVRLINRSYFHIHRIRSAVHQIRLILEGDSEQNGGFELQSLCVRVRLRAAGAWL